MTVRVRMTRITLAAMLLLASIALVAPSVEALESSGYSLEILVDGRPLTEFDARSTTYIEARKGAEYSIRLRNHTNRRIAVALAVDGLNTIDAKTTTARQASKWVLGPYETTIVDGWQTGPETARRFFFTTEDRSYGAWLGRTSNLGVIEAVVYRERRPVIARRQKRFETHESGESMSEGRLRAIPDPSPTDDFAATGIGDEIGNRVVQVPFKAETRPAADMRIRYEYRLQLVELGVLPPLRRLDRRERARGFEDFEFSPDPYEGR